MKNLARRVSGLVILLLAGGIPVLAQGQGQGHDPALTLPVSGNGFTGTATITAFVNQGGHIVAMGTVANSTRTAIAGVAWTVTLGTNASGLAAAYSGQTPARAHLSRIAWSPDRQSGARLVPVQTSTSCGVLNITLGATTVNLAGAEVDLPAIGPISISGQSGTPVGGIVCNVESLVTSVGGIVGSVANVVNLLNSLLGSLTGSLGSLTGGTGGAGGLIP